MDPIFEHPAFDSARERVKCVIEQPGKPQETFEDSLYTCFKCGSKKIFYIVKQVRSADREHLYSTSVVIVTINGGIDDTHYAASINIERFVM